MKQRLDPAAYTLTMVHAKLSSPTQLFLGRHNLLASVIPLTHFKESRAIRSLTLRYVIGVAIFAPTAIGEATRRRPTSMKMLI